MNVHGFTALVTGANRGIGARSSEPCSPPAPLKVYAAARKADCRK